MSADRPAGDLAHEAFLSISREFPAAKSLTNG